MVTEVRDLEQAFAELDRVLVRGCGLPRPGWLDEAEAAWAAPAAGPRAAATRRGAHLAAAVDGAGPGHLRRGSAGPAGRTTRCTPAHAERYPRIPIDELRGAAPELVVLPDEPYRFTADDGPEAFPGLPAALVSGRHLTWYGPSLAEAPAGARRGAASSAPLKQPAQRCAAAAGAHARDEDAPYSADREPAEQRAARCAGPAPPPP